MSALRELIAKFYVEADTKELEKAEEKIGSFTSKLKEVGEALASAFAVEKLREFVEGQVEAGAQLKITADRLGTSTEELQAMDLAAQQAGVGADSLSTSLRFLNKNISLGTTAGSEQARTFQQLGIELKNTDGTTRTSSEVLGELADKVSALHDPAKQTELAMRLLGRGGAELIPLLKKGGAAFQEAREQAALLGGGYSNEFVEQAHEAEAAQVRLTFALTSLKSRAAQTLLPILEKIVNWFTTLAVRATDFAKHTDALSHAMQFFGVVAGAKALQTVIHLGKEFGLLKGNILQSVGAMLRFAAPLLIIGLLYLAYDELATLLAGGDTLIGDALGPDKRVFVEELRAAVDELEGAFGDLGKTLGGDGTAMSAFAGTVKFVAEAVGYLVIGINAVVQALGKVVEVAATAGIAIAKVFGGGPGKETLGNVATGGLTPEAVQRLSDIGVAPGQLAPIEALGRKNTTTTRSTSEVVSTPAFVRPGTAQVPAPGGGGGSTDNSTTVNQTLNTNVEVHGVPTDQARPVGDAVGAGVATGVQRANDRSLTKYQRP